MPFLYFWVCTKGTQVCLGIHVFILVTKDLKRRKLRHFILKGYPHQRRIGIRPELSGQIAIFMAIHLLNSRQMPIRLRCGWALTAGMFSRKAFYNCERCELHHLFRHFSFVVGYFPNLVSPSHCDSFGPQSVGMVGHVPSLL